MSAIDHHEMTLDEPPKPNAYVVRCNCGWISKVASSDMNVLVKLFEVHVLQALGKQ